MKYILSYKTKFGTISAESDKPNELVGAYTDLKNIAESIAASKGRVTGFARALKLARKKKAAGVSRARPAEQRRGKGETAAILREIEDRLLNTNFFAKPRTTGETRDRLFQVSRKSFTSRKVSQALGILWAKGALKRSGTRNYFAYSK